MAQAPAAQARPSPNTPPRPVYGSGHRTEPRRRRTLFAPFCTTKARNLSLRQGTPQACCSRTCTGGEVSQTEKKQKMVRHTSYKNERNETPTSTRCHTPPSSQLVQTHTAHTHPFTQTRPTHGRVAGDALYRNAAGSERSRGELRPPEPVSRLGRPDWGTRRAARYHGGRRRLNRGPTARCW